MTDPLTMRLDGVAVNVDGSTLAESDLAPPECGLAAGSGAGDDDQEPGLMVDRSFRHDAILSCNATHLSQILGSDGSPSHSGRFTTRRVSAADGV